MSENQRSTTSLKVIAIFLAVLLWLYVSTENTIITRKEVEVQLQAVNLEEGMKASHLDKVSISFIGTPRKAEDINAYVNLKGLEPGVYTLPVEVGSLKGARVTGINPAQVKVQISQQGEHIFPITHKVTKSPPAGYRLEGVTMVPEKCLVKGPRHLVNQVADVVVYLDLGGLTQTSTYEAQVRAIDREGKPLTGDLTFIPNQVKVYVVLGEKKDMLEVEVNPTLSGQPAEGFSLGEVRVDPPRVQLIGKSGVLQGQTEAATEAINLEGRTTSFVEEVKIVGAPGVEIYPSRVRVHVQVQQSINGADRLENGESP